MTRYLAIALTLFAASHATAAQRELERSFTVSPGETLVVEADSASVHVSADDGNQVTVRMRASGPEEQLARMQLDASRNNGTVTALMKREGKEGFFKWGSWNVDGEIQVTVPRNHQVTVRTSGGDVELQGTAGSASLRSSGGDIKAKGVTGNLQVRTSGGGIYAEEIRGDIDVATSGGDLRLLGVDGKIQGRTSGGSVKCSLVGANRGISTKTSGGSIELIVPSVTKGRIEATTSGGGISSNLPLSTSSRSEHHLSGSLNGGGELIDLSTSGGSISVRAGD